jgi:predicted RNA binding protein YcfA (HicA-like mRNA interferase family)
MKRNALLKHLKKYGCKFFREGKKHTIYWNPANRRTAAIPRHKEIVDKLAYKICKELDIPVL